MNKENKDTSYSKTSLVTADRVSAIIPRNYDEVWRYATGIVRSRMMPDSCLIEDEVPVTNEHGKTVIQKRMNGEATTARVATIIAKGMEVGLPPVTALQTICIINNRPCLWGDGAVALVQASGIVEYIKSYYEGDDETKPEYTAHYILKRKDQPEEYHRTFSMGDAKRANLLGKRGPWAYGYAKRMLMMRAQAWALRDGASDILMGIGIAEEVRDFQNVEEKRSVTNTSSLDDDFTPALEDKTKESVYVGVDLADPASDKTVKVSVPAQGSLLSNAEIQTKNQKDETNEK